MAKNRMPLPPQAAEQSDMEDVPELDAASEDMPDELLEKPVPVLRKKLKVVANRAGFFDQERKMAGDKFDVHEHELGSWMDCVDPVEHKKHQKRLAEKKKRANVKGMKEDNSADE